MNCIKLNIRSVIIIMLSVMFNGVKYSHMAVNNDMDEVIVKEQKKNTSSLHDAKPVNPTDHRTTNELEKFDPEFCNSLNLPCNDMPYPCIKCDMNETCVYGQHQTANCSIRSDRIVCKGDKKFQRDMICRYCYQTDIWEHSCTQKAGCNSVSTPRATYRTNCSTHGDVICLGKRDFLKNVQCNWTGGYKWSTALMLSITLGGFGADRFYLGHWQEGIGKLFSFGGLGVWTLIDVILISLHYLGPADGSLFL